MKIYDKHQAVLLYGPSMISMLLLIELTLGEKLHET